ncbi:tc5 transposase DNA-binding domain-containing protein [Hirsutella rhossiliensis]|uniref:Tc5 transposase DNA-binding domain-containing protein n=1 Tax=Hirsutella rhossiliensis TaxID=111463 RepID=A0A9P8MZJ2_9HYPO|nr:tc5 transposase DNA-binding domain-containing protein [Hirsutella rhossiliensis]KAH0964165.1 tc5 transposase DNA-binding domain-containing protein [Hirsutella rhossiliensis]
MPHISKYTENQLQEALVAIKNGMPQLCASRKWGIPRTTLQSRLKGALPMKEAKEAYQRLSQEQEKHLCDWVLAQAALGLPPTHHQLKEFAGRILIAGGDPRPLGINWVSGFLARNPEVSTIKGKALESARVNGASVARIKERF